MRNKPLFQAAAFLLAVIVAAGVGYRVGSQRPIDAAPKPAPQAPVVARKPLYWYDPMKPDQHFDKPGKSPFMDMDLVPKYATDASVDNDPDNGGVAIDAQMSQRLGIRLAAVERVTFQMKAEAVGTVGADENRMVSVQARSPGWVEALHVRAVEQAVSRGQLLAEIYSPELLAAQEELLLARRSGDSGLVDASRERLRLLGVSDEQITRIERDGRASRRIALYSPVGGVVQALGARQGMQLMPGTSLFNLVDLSQVWVLAELPEAQAAQVRAGETVQVEPPSLPQRRFNGKVDYIYPDVNPQTRTLKLRVVLANPTLALKPGMYARVLLSGAERQVLTVPSEAVIRTGERSIVIVAGASQRYHPIEVRIGQESGGRSEILSGLEEGQQVVASGQFLIDSEANLRGALNRIGASAADRHDHQHVSTEPQP